MHGSRMFHHNETSEFFFFFFFWVFVFCDEIPFFLQLSLSEKKKLQYVDFPATSDDTLLFAPFGPFLETHHVSFSRKAQTDIYFY